MPNSLEITTYPFEKKSLITTMLAHTITEHNNEEPFAPVVVHLVSLL